MSGHEEDQEVSTERTSKTVREALHEELTSTIRYWALAVALIGLAAGAWLSYNGLRYRRLAALRSAGIETDAVVKVVSRRAEGGSFFDLLERWWSGSVQVGYVYRTGGEVRHASAPLSPGDSTIGKVDPGSYLKVRHDPRRPEVSVPVEASLGVMWVSTLAAGALLVFMAIAVVASVVRRASDGKLLLLCLVVVAIGGALGYLFVRFQTRQTTRSEEAAAAASRKGDWGFHDWVEKGGVLEIGVLGVADDTYAHGQLQTNVVDNPFLSFGSYDVKWTDHALARFLLEIPPGSRIVRARLVVRSTHGNKGAGEGRAEFDVVPISGVHRFDKKRFPSYEGLLGIPVLGRPVRWVAGRWQAGEESRYSSPDIGRLVQEFVSSPGYSPPAFLGIRISPAGTARHEGWKHKRLVGSAESGKGIRMHVEYTHPRKGGV